MCLCAEKSRKCCGPIFSWRSVWLKAKILTIKTMQWFSLQSVLVFFCSVYSVVSCTVVVFLAAVNAIWTCRLHLFQCSETHQGMWRSSVSLRKHRCPEGSSLLGFHSIFSCSSGGYRAHKWLKGGHKRAKKYIYKTVKGKTMAGSVGAELCMLLF